MVNGTVIGGNQIPMLRHTLQVLMWFFFFKERAQISSPGVLVAQCR